MSNDSSKWVRNAADERAVAAGCYFDEKAAMRVVNFFPKFLRLSKGEWYGKPFELQAWQRDDVLMPLFGWKRADGLRRFRKAFVFLPKKNGKSAMAAGIGLYMLTADGEGGAEVYSAATDQQQASIVHGEAINMAKASPTLESMLTVNQSTKAISFHKTNSVYRALSSEHRGSEGLNAHAIIADELHVWHGRRLWDSLKYASRARRQPMLFVITTAGDDIKSVCYEQYDYAKAVLAGTVDDERFFGYICEATPAEDWKSEATWKKANPSFGVTVKAEDFAADVREAERSPTLQASFKRYSLNVWQSSTNPWLSFDAWDACRKSFTEEDVIGWQCCGGLDLSKTRDMTAFVLVFRNPDDREHYRILPWFWLPQETVNDPNSPEEYRVWQRGGWLKTMPGSTCDYSFVRSQIVALYEKFGPFQYAFDPAFAQDTEQQLKRDHDITGVEFRQTIMNFTGATTEFERLVISGRIEHNGHPILTWQAGNCSVYTDSNGNKRPVKPPHGDHRKIDGIVAGIMSLGLLIKESEVGSMYEREGFKTLA